MHEEFEQAAVLATYLKIPGSRQRLRGQGSFHRKLLPSGYERLLESMKTVCLEQKIRILTWDSADFPELLKEIPCPPRWLFYRGDSRALHGQRMLAVVGSRQMSSYGQEVLSSLIPELIALEFTIVSGLAYGVDSFAHQLTVRHGGRAVAVLGNGIDDVYPRAQYRLSEEILASGGVIVSEYPPHTPPQSFSFPARNRIISGLCQATAVIEAKHGSGSLITARHALDQNRDVYAVPGNIFVGLQEGTNALIAEGARPLLSVQDLLLEGVSLLSKASQRLDFAGEPRTIAMEFLPS